ncbi:MAG: serine/threonine-protein kinase, partial [Myxococcota bacterium]
MPEDAPPPTALTWAVAEDALAEQAQRTAGTLDLGDRYVDRGVLGVGGMGEVRRVHDRRLDCGVVMKILGRSLVDDARARARFVNEGTITAQLRHPGIVAVHDRGELADRRLWYTMSEVDGSTLQTTEVASRDPVALRSWVGVLQRVCDAMAYAHDHGVLHRDLKPSNLMVGRFGEVMVMDWGIALGREAEREAPGSVLGTPRYMAPEQARGEIEAMGPWSDVYSLGLVLYERLSGRSLVEGPSTE